MRPFVLPLLALASVVPASASTLLVSTSGSFTNQIPNGTFSKPNASYSFSFDVSSTPTVSSANSNGFDVAFTNLSYVVNGKSIAAPSSGVAFFSAGDSGLLDLCFDAACPTGNGAAPDNGFVIEGAQAFSGSTTDPTILAGHYAETANVFLDNGAAYILSDGTLSIAPVGVTTTPEPATFALLGTGMLGAAGAIRRRLAR